MVARFGPPVRSMGLWNKTGDGSIEIPMADVIEAARGFRDGLAEAVSQLKAGGGLATMPYNSSAKRLIEALSNPYLQEFQNRAERFQDASDPADAARLWSGIDRDFFARELILHAADSMASASARCAEPFAGPSAHAGNRGSRPYAAAGVDWRRPRITLRDVVQGLWIFKLGKGAIPKTFPYARPALLRKGRPTPPRVATRAYAKIKEHP